MKKESKMTKKTTPQIMEKTKQNKYVTITYRTATLNLNTNGY